MTLAGATEKETPIGSFVSLDFVHSVIYIADKDRGTLETVSLLGLVARLKFDRKMYVETFNGSFSYTEWTSSNVPLLLECDDESNVENKHDVEYKRYEMVMGYPLLSFDWHLRTFGTPDSLMEKMIVSEDRVLANENEMSAIAMLRVSHRQSNRTHLHPSLFKRFGKGVRIQDVVEKCFFRFPRSAEQTEWPIRSVVDSRGRRVDSKDRLALRLATNVESVHRRVFLERQDLLEPVSDLERRRTLRRRIEEKYPDVTSSWHAAVQPLPNYCGILDGELSEADVHRLRVHHENSLIELRVGNRMSIPGVSQIIDFVVKLIMPPIFDPFTDELTRQLGNNLGSETSHQLNSQTPWDASDKIGKQLRQNLVSVLPDALAAHMTESIATELTMEIGPDLLKEVSRAVVARAHRGIADTLSTSVPRRIAAVVPYLMERSLAITLTRSLTRSVTHALIPTVSYALTRRPGQEFACDACYHLGERCELCHDSTVSQYYMNYYAAYYSDVYAEWYEDYYVRALLAMDRKQHGRTDATMKASASPSAKEARQKNLGAAEFGEPMQWQRGLSPSGLPPDERFGAPPVGSNANNAGVGMSTTAHSTGLRPPYWTRPDKRGNPSIQGNAWGGPREIKENNGLVTGRKR